MWKGFSFRFSTHENQRMRNIQLDAIESELVQAIDRSRSLCTVDGVLVYSNLPLQIATSIEPYINGSYKKVLSPILGCNPYTPLVRDDYNNNFLEAL